MTATALFLLLARSLVVLQPDPQPLETCQSLMREYAAAHQKSKEAARRNLPPIPFPDVDEYARRFLRYAETHPGRPDAVDALLWIVEGGLYFHDSAPSMAPTVNRAMDRLEADHLGDEKLGLACLQLTNYPSPLRDRFLRTVLERTPSHSVRGRAALALAESLTTRAAFVSQHRSEKRTPDEQSRFETLYGGGAYVKALLASDPQSWIAEADALYARVALEYGDVPYRRGAWNIIKAAPAEPPAYDGRSLADVADAALHRAVGQTAPEIEGEDVDGKRFKLSDHRGKVVLLTFSGNWCGPCRAMYDQERALVARLKGRPFAVLSVNTDVDEATLRRAIASGEITWRCWHESGTHGPITTRWNVVSYPTVYLIDPSGVIVAKDPDGPRIDDAVDALLDKLRRDAPPVSPR